MSQLLFKTMDRLTPALRAGDLASCEREVIVQFQRQPDSPFHAAIHLNISNDPAAIAAHLDRFFAREAQRFTIAASYTEMNGFDINPDRWYCDIFAYREYGGHDDYDWLSDWQSAQFEEFEIHGLEKLQEVYASKAFQNDSFREAATLCGLLVVIKFQRFVSQTVPLMEKLRFPLLSTAHDYDFIAEVKPTLY